MDINFETEHNKKFLTLIVVCSPLYAAAVYSTHSIPGVTSTTSSDLVVCNVHLHTINTTTIKIIIKLTSDIYWCEGIKTY